MDMKVGPEFLPSSLATPAAADSTIITTTTYCLICHNLKRGINGEGEEESKPPWREFPLRGEEDACLREQLWSLFVLRKLLDFSQQECEALLRNTFGVNPSSWIDLCLECSGLVKDAVELNQQIVKLEGALLKIKMRIQGKLNESAELEEVVKEEVMEDDEGQQPGGGVLNIRQMIRGNIFSAKFRKLKEGSPTFHEEQILPMDVLHVDYGSEDLYDTLCEPDRRRRRGIKDNPSRNPSKKAKVSKGKGMRKRGRPRKNNEPFDNGKITNGSKPQRAKVASRIEMIQLRNDDEELMDLDFEIGDNDNGEEESSQDPLFDAQSILQEDDDDDDDDDDNWSTKDMKKRQHVRPKKALATKRGLLGRKQKTKIKKIRPPKVRIPVNNMPHSSMTASTECSAEGTGAGAATRTKASSSVNNKVVAQGKIQSLALKVMSEPKVKNTLANGNKKKKAASRAGFCSICKHICPDRKSYEIHKRKHELYPHLACKICSFPHKSELHLHHHLSSKHGTVGDAVKPVEVAPSEPGLPAKVAFQCKFCSYTSANFSHTKIHEDAHKYWDNIEAIDGTDRYSCKLCNFQETARYVRKHITEEHGVEVGMEPVLCHLCDKVFPRASSLTGHIRHCHGDIRFTCKHCGRGFRRRATYNAHLERCQNGGKNVVTCELCGLTYTEHRQLMRHKGKFHSEATNNNNTAPTSETGKGPASDRKRPTKCKYCGLQLIHDKALKVHFRDAHPELYKYKCDECDAAYMQPGGLKTHKDAKHLNKKVNCPYCQSEVGCEAFLKGHWQKHCRKVPGRREPEPAEEGDAKPGVLLDLK